MILTLVISISGCTKEHDNNVGEIRSYADPIIKHTISGMQEDDYAKFSRYFDEDMKEALPEDEFTIINGTLKRVIGDYVSIKYSTIEKHEEYIIVRYKAKYSNETADVNITTSFHEVGNEMLLGGLWFNSPKLSEQ